MSNLNPNINVNWVPGITLDEMEKQCILQAFRFYRGNKTQTAGALGIAIRTLEHKLERYEADAKREEERIIADKQRSADILARMRGPDILKYHAVGNAHQIQNAQQPTPGLKTSTRVPVESAEEVSTQQSVSVSKREEVQAVLPKHASSHSQRKGR